MTAPEPGEASSTDPGAGFPRLLGAYVLLGRLSEGGMGRVYLALSRQDGNEQLCVIKRFGNPGAHLTARQTRENRQRFRREAKIAMAILHPSVARAFRYVDDGAQPYIVQEFVYGLTLEHLGAAMAKQDEHFSPALAAYVVGQMARALDYLHEFRHVGLVHRDLSPSNVMISHLGEVKVIDFGIAKATLVDATLTKPHVLIGKPGWIAPEVIAGQKPDRRADLFALGLLLWYLLAGRRPDERESAVPHLPAPSTFNLSLPPGMDDLVMKAIDQNPDRRFQTARAFLESVVPFMPASDRGPADLAELIKRFHPTLARQFFAQALRSGRRLLERAQEPRAPRWHRLAWLGLPVLAVLALSRITQRLPPHGPPARPAQLAPPRVSRSAPPEVATAVPGAWPAAAPRPGSALALPAAPLIANPTPAVPHSRAPAAPAAPAFPPPSEVKPPPPRRLTPPPDSTLAPSLLASAIQAFARGEADRALRLARASAKRRPSPEAFLLTGRILFQTEPEQARAALQNALRLSPDDPDADRLLAVLNARMP